MGLESKIYFTAVVVITHVTRSFTWILYSFRSRHLYFDLGSTFGFLKARFQQRARREISRSRQDTLYGLAGRLLRITAVEIITNFRVQTTDRKRGRDIQVRIGWFVAVSREQIENSMGLIPIAGFQYHFGDRRSHYIGEAKRRQRRVGRGCFSIHFKAKESRYMR